MVVKKVKRAKRKTVMVYFFGTALKDGKKTMADVKKLLSEKK